MPENGEGRSICMLEQMRKKHEHKLQECKMDYDAFTPGSSIAFIPVGTCNVRAYSQVFHYWASYARTPTIIKEQKKNYNGLRPFFCCFFVDFILL